MDSCAIRQLANLAVRKWRDLVKLCTTGTVGDEQHRAPVGRERALQEVRRVVDAGRIGDAVDSGAGGAVTFDGVFRRKAIALAHCTRPFLKIRMCCQGSGSSSLSK